MNIEGPNGKRKALDSDINMIPMIDLLMVTISFLLITAVWAHSQRLDANAQVPGPMTDTPPCGADCKEETKLHIETSDPAKFVLAWKQGRTVVRVAEIARETRKKNGFPSLAAKVDAEWRAAGAHQAATDRQFDRAVVHTTNDMPYSELIAVMDAINQPKREYVTGDKRVATNAFEVTFAAD